MKHANKKQFLIEGLTSVCALLSSITVLILLFFKKWISVNLLQSETVTVFELSDIIESYRRMVESFGFGNPDEIAKSFSDLDFISTVFVVLSIVIAVVLMIHILFLIFGKGKWIRSTSILSFILYLGLIIGFSMFAEKVNESVGEIDLMFVSLANVLSVENSIFYVFIPLGIGIVSSFIYTHYKKNDKTAG